MPDFEITRQTMGFWHSNEERSQFIRDFLKAINVCNIDSLICHSSGIHPISMIWSQPQDLLIKSIGMFCPSIWVSRYYYFVGKFFTRFARNKYGIKLMEIIKLHSFANKFYYALSYENVEQVLQVMLCSTGTQQQLLHQRLNYLRDNKIPTLVVLGDEDVVQDKQHIKRFVEDLGADYRDYRYL
ncbi:unnamed protein product [Oppiella nova]|uniref:Alpha/beta hydrolase n=1 Tax=Oppiella nova TaxID=334625 RepID=A0A7R9MBV4_9ACAR|nr:unnamed protein product [Oppiella nova]CAG2174008.1 unnamed protein product [Oppiella nova]